MTSYWPRIAVFIGILAILSSMVVVGRAQQSPAPRVWSIAPESSASGTVTFTVTFNEAVDGVNTQDFRVLESQDASISNVRAGANTSIYLVDVSYGQSVSEIVLVLIDDDSIVNEAGIPLGGQGVSNGNAVSSAFSQPNVDNPQQAILFDDPSSILINVGSSSSMALNAHGMPVISYFDTTNRDLKLAICNDNRCTSPTIRTVDSTGDVGYFSSVAITSDNKPVISYFDDTFFDLKLLVCTDATCTSSMKTTVDVTGDVGNFNALTLNSNDIPIISYHDYSNRNLKLAICNDLACANPTISVIASTGITGEDNSIDITSDDRPVLSYYDWTLGALRMAVCSNPACDSYTISTIDSNGDPGRGVGKHTSIQLTSSDIPVISYHDSTNSNLKLAVCNSIVCDTPTLRTLDSTGSVGYYTSVGLTSSNIPIISYYDYTNTNLKSITCDNTSCSSYTTNILDTVGSVGSFTAIKISDNNIPFISYYDESNGNLNLHVGASQSAIDNGQPNTFTKSFPVNNATNQSTSVSLLWQYSTGATEYEYCIATSAADCTTWVSTGTSTSVSLTGLTPETTYYWQVRATNSAGTTIANTNTPWRFAVHTPRVASDGIWAGSYNDIQLTRTNTPVVSLVADDNIQLIICDTLACRDPIVRIIADEGYSTSLVLTNTDIPIISYYDNLQSDLHLAICNDADCDNPTITVVDNSANAVGWESSLALTSTGIPVISYADTSDNKLKLAICNSLTCTAPTIRDIDTTGIVGSQTELVLTSTNIPIISYYDATNTNLKLAVCDNTSCASPTLSVIDSTGMVGLYASMAITSDDIPVMSYNDFTAGELILAMCDNTACANPTIRTLESGVIASGWDNSLALTSDNLPVISYYNDISGDLSLIYCHTRNCGSHDTQLLDSIGIVGEYNTLALTSNDIPVIAYADSTNGNLKLDVAADTIYSGEPVDFVMTAPGNSTTITTSSVIIAWNAVAGATSYEYCIAQSVAICTTWISTGTATTTTVASLAHNTTYYWQVRATNAAGSTLANSGTPWRFFVALPPNTFAKSAPANNATRQKTNVTLTWAASTRATSYEYCIALTTATCTTWKSTGAARTVTVTGLAKNKAYFWQVRAKNAGGTTTATGPTWKFTTAP